MKTVDLFRKTLDVFFEKKITSQSRLADELNIHRGNMNKFVKNRCGFSEARKELISKHLGFSYPEFLDLGRRLAGHEPFYWAMREVWLDDTRRTALIEKLGVEEGSVFSSLRKMLLLESMKADIVAALGTTHMEMVERGKEILITNPGIRWDLNDGYKMVSSSVGMNWTAEPTPPEPAEPECPSETIGTRLRSSRDNLGLTQAQMAEKLGIGLSSYQCYERGERDIPSSVLVTLVGVGVDATWLLTGCVAEEPKKVVGYDDVVVRHFEIIRQFKNREEAKEVNQDLLALEQLSEKDFFKATAYIKGLLDGCKDKVEEQVPGKKKTGNG